MVPHCNKRINILKHIPRRRPLPDSVASTPQS
uniref:Uncharacterized protein n=1 Tax=Anguilla anguilla TaxID=7936 RepID=A0A0E9UES0_ANGAN